MDRDDNPAELLEPALRDLHDVNRFLGGRRAVFRALEPYLRSPPGNRPLAILDVGTGGGDLPRAIADLAAARGTCTKIVAVDRDAVTARFARRAATGRPEVRVVRADAFDLPFRDRSFDVVLAATFLHHFRHDDVVRLLRRFTTLARRAVVVVDLRRHRAAWLGIRAIGALAFRSAMSRHDGPLSVLRAFTAAELAEAGRETGAERVRVARVWPFRLTLVLEAPR